MKKFMTRKNRSKITCLMRTLLRLGLMSTKEFEEMDKALEASIRTHTVSSRPMSMPPYRVKDR